MKLHYFWSIDPGYFHLKRALKTIAAILVTLALLQTESLLTQSMACIVTGFSMQGIVAKTPTSRIKQVLVLNVAYFLVFNLGLLVRESTVWSAITFITLGFTANYIRRFGLQNSVAPMMGWSICFLAKTLPFSESIRAGQHFGPLLTALSVSAFMLLVVFPENYPRLFVNNTNRSFALMAEGLRLLRKHTLYLHMDKQGPNNALENIAKQLTKLLDINQTIAQSNLFTANHYHIITLISHQYALIHVYRMMLDALKILKRHHYPIPTQTRLKLSISYKRFERIFSSLYMQEDLWIVSQPSHLASPLQKNIFHNTSTEPFAIIVMLNLKLSFMLLEQHINLLQRGNYEHA